ncbi:MAG TPA: glycosyltransferase family 39 protein [Gemmatimonadales bacterium]
MFASQQPQLIAVLALAFAVRVAGLNFESFSMDEVTELQTTRLPLPRIVLLPDGFPPLYHILLKGWLMLWGTPLAARWLSAVLGLVTVYVVYRLALATAGRTAGIAASLLAAISPLHVWFAQESRAYALALPLAALALWRFHQAYTTNTWRGWLVYGGVALAAVCTHYFLAILLALQALWYLPQLVRRGRYRYPAVAVYGLLLLAALPVMRVLAPDLTYQSGTGEGKVGLGALLYTPYALLLGFSTGPSLRELHETELRRAAIGFLPGITALALCLVPLGISWLRRSHRSSETVGYFVVMFLGPPAVTAILSNMFDLKYKVSYVSWASIPLLILLGHAIASGWQRWSTRVATAGYACLALVALGNRHLVDRYRTEDVRAAAAYIQTHSPQGTPVFVVARYMAEPLAFYLDPQWQVTGLATGPAAQDSITNLLHGPATGSAWLVYSRPFHGDPSGEIRARLSSNSAIRLAARFAGVELYRFEPAKKGRPRS